LSIDLAAIGGSVLQVLVVGLLFGAGLPALFALGVRASAVADSSVDGRPAQGRAVAVLCFGLAAVAVAAGIVVIVFGKQIFGG